MHSNVWTAVGTRALRITVKGTLGTTPVTNTAATGEPSISGTATVGQVLTATTGTIADADGLPSSFTYQWVRLDADGTSNEEDITGANSSTYTLDDNDEGKKIKVKVSFTDNGGNSEMRTSGAYPTSGTVQASTTPASAALVSNLGQTGNDLAGLGGVGGVDACPAIHDRHQRHRLHPDQHRASPRLPVSSTDTPTVKLYSGSANGTEVSTFTGPAMLDASSTKNYAFTPSSTVTLGMSTTYWVVAEANTGDASLVLRLPPPARTQPPPRVGKSAMVAEERSASSTGSFAIEILELSF